VDGHFLEHVFEASGPGNTGGLTDIGLVGLRQIPGALNACANFRIDIFAAGHVFETTALF
jgi:hypothetical protein